MLTQCDDQTCAECYGEQPTPPPAAVTAAHLAALRAAIGMSNSLWEYWAGSEYDGFPLADVPGTLADLLAVLEGES